MAHGGPDWGTAGPLGTVYTIEDMAELAVRLGSPISFDRRGNVMWYDDFEHSLNKWFIGLLGGSVAITNEKARTGALSCKVITDNITGSETHLIHREPYPALSRLGIEFSLLTTLDEAVLDLHFNIFTGTYAHIAAIKYDFTTHTWQYNNSLGLWADLPIPVRLIPSLYIFHTIKLVIDPETHHYKHFICNNVAYDMSALAYHYPADGRAPFIQIDINYYPTEDVSKTIYYDDIILTQNEP